MLTEWDVNIQKRSAKVDFSFNEIFSTNCRKIMSNNFVIHSDTNYANYYEIAEGRHLQKTLDLPYMITAGMRVTALQMKYDLC